jgi:ERCC4-type nuclease
MLAPLTTASGNIQTPSPNGSLQIILDEREVSLYEKCITMTTKNTVTKRVLSLGDISIRDEHDAEIMLIERKSLTDLIASIKDGRYEEQSYRLIHASGVYRHHIVYIVEGLLSQLHNPAEKKMVYSAMTSLLMFKGFSVIRTNSVQETADWIVNCADKLSREMARGSQPWIGTTSAVDESPPPPYCSVVKKTKKDNLTPENIGEIMLCQIPGISTVSAVAIMQKYRTISNLIDNIKTNPECLDDIACESRGKTRKIGKNIIQNIIAFLV